MGGTESKAVVVNVANKMIINESTVNIVNQQLNTMVANAIIKDAKNCGAALAADQSINVKRIKVEGDIIIKANQKQKVQLSFGCVQASAVRNDVANDMVAKMMAGLETSTSTDVLEKLEAIADAKAKSELGSDPLGTKASSVSEQISNYTQKTTTHKNIENIVKNATESNFTSDTVQNCLSKIIAEQTVDVEDAESRKGNFILEVDQDQAVDMVMSCIQNSDVSQKITAQVLSDLKVETKDTSETKIVTEMKGKATASAESTGFAGMIKALGAMLAALGLGFISPIVALCSSVYSSTISCCCCLLIVGVIMMATSSGGGAQGSGASGTGQNFSHNMSNVLGSAKHFIPSTVSQNMATIGPNLQKLLNQSGGNIIDNIQKAFIRQK